MKRPWLAVLLNCFPLVFGLGYIYLGRWARFLGVFVLGQMFLGSLLRFSLGNLLALFLGPDAKNLIFVPFWFWTMYDVWRLTKQHNTAFAAERAPPKPEPIAEVPVGWPG